MSTSNALRSGGALAATVAIGYALCTLVFWIFPESAAAFMNALFHGLDFRPLADPAAFTLASFLWGAAILAAWAFMLGAIFGWISGRLAHTS